MKPDNIQQDIQLSQLLREVEVKAPQGLSGKIMQRIFADEKIQASQTKKIFVRKDFSWFNIILALMMGLLILSGISYIFVGQEKTDINLIINLGQYVQTIKYVLPLISISAIYFLYVQLDKYLMQTRHKTT